MDEQQTANHNPDSETAAGTTPEPHGDDVNTDIAPEFELVRIEYDGLVFTVPKDRGQWDMNVQFEFEEGRRLRGYLVLLGGSLENVEVTRARVYSRCRTTREVEKFLDHITEVCNAECI
ncbi:hypothetical protein SEA_WEBSTER2_18 [Mycobacterium phage Webster2]|uniref:Uncharacterized protein n=1 Tax=Mycobacterium phage Webster2 TaxID=2759451 RepID=A0A7G8ZZJ7_9CAUD|nr:hypothetical protein SEA_WEBSTER2_18 [Mycobacterium phage Webster2]